MSAPLVSVIIPAWNGRDHLPACLAALLATPAPSLEAIVVDNASTDGSAALVAQSFPAVRLVQNPHNLGFAGGCNAGLRVARGRVLVLLNQDAQPRPDWLPPLVAALDEPTVGAAGCKIFYPDGKTIQHAGVAMEWPRALAHHLGYQQPDGDEWDIPRAVEGLTGAALAFRRDVMERVGMLDEGFWPGYFEDADFCARLRAAGYTLRYVPAATVLHAESTSIREAHALSEHYQRGRLRFLLKHLPPARFLGEFVPAEEASQRAAIFGQESRSLRLAYLSAISQAAPLLSRHWQASPATVEAVVRALQGLHQRAWLLEWERGMAVDIAELPQDAGLAPLPAHAAPDPLRPFEFHSAAPLVGHLLSRLRGAWYNVAARWADYDLQEQVDRAHQQQTRVQNFYVQALEQRLRALSEENALLAQELARLRLDIERGTGDTGSAPPLD